MHLALPISQGRGDVQIFMCARELSCTVTASEISPPRVSTCTFCLTTCRSNLGLPEEKDVWVIRASRNATFGHSPLSCEISPKQTIALKHGWIGKSETTLHPAQ